ncbi:MAG TPA: SNF2-related protein [Streptosporangiaceae bacterium]|nr:SNF2-related protein [Streptosporangiaceae bacterium]
MQRVVLPDLDPATLAHAVDSRSYARGLEYLRQKAVAQMWWDPADETLNGIVRGSDHEIYSTTAYFSLAGGGRLEFDQGTCTCPVGYNCKHTVALVLSAVESISAAGDVVGPPAGAKSRGAKSPSSAWEQSLGSLLSAAPSLAAGQPAQTPLAVELSLAQNARHRYHAHVATAGDQGLRLVARMVRPGKNGGWVGGTLTWSKLDSLSHYGSESYSKSQVRLLKEIYALYRAAAGGFGYYSYGDQKTIELSAFESRQLWPLLDEARSIGLRLVHCRKLGDVDQHGEADLCLDVVGSSSGLVITPLVRTGAEGADTVPITFIGSQGHGLVYADRAEVRANGGPVGVRFRLARLSVPVSPELQRLALAGEPLAVPADQQARFRDTYYPRLRRAAAIVSSDGSFTPPEISGPTLVLRVSYGDRHQVDLAWEWAYRVGESQVRSAPGLARADEADYRDAEAERALLAGLDLPLERFGLIRPDPTGQALGQALVPQVRLDGIDTMRFSTELLPLLRGQVGLIAEITGAPADYREASDSLRIGISAGEIAGDTDWFDLGITIAVDGKTVPFADVFVALSRGETHLLLDDGAYFSLDKLELQALARLIDEARALQDSLGSSLRISRFQAGLWQELTELGVVGHQTRAWQDQVAGLLSVHSVEARQPPATLQAELRPYQRDGFNWLAFLWEHQLGGILADDMGLGKTLQSLALICHARQADPSAPPFLIVAPTSVVPNWCAEASRFAPGLKVVPVTDTMARRGQELDEVVAGADAVVTTYALLRIDFPAYQASGWSGLILDEAQFTKNHQSKVYQCARRLTAPVKMAITGTPMENNLMELWSLLSITAPGLFPSPTRFRDYYARPIERDDRPELLAQLRRRIKPLVMRRTKEQVASDLPAKQEQVLSVDLHPQHRKIYETHLQRERQRVLGLIGDMDTNRFAIFRSLTLLRQLSLHAGLVDDRYADLPSSKIELLLDQVRDVVTGGHRALVFSQFTGFLAKVRAGLDANGLTYCYLDGSTPNRAAVIRRFKSGTAPVFLISLKAGGFGLNLTEADYCFLLDPWWNPATEAQAVDRTHRIGQTRNVMVYRLIASGTIEEKVMALKARKAELFASVMDEGNVFGTGLDAEDIRNLFA